MIRPPRRRASPQWHQRGYALHEVLIALSLTGLVTLAIFAAFKAGNTAWTTSQQFVAEQQNARSLLAAIARSARMIGYQYTGAASSMIYGGASDLSFYADIDGDGTIECYRYYLNNGVVYQAVVQGLSCASTILTTAGRPLTAALEARTLAVSNLTFIYYAAADVGAAQLSTPLSATDLSLVRRIDIAARVKGQVSSGGPFTVDVQAVVRAGR